MKKFLLILSSLTLIISCSHSVQAQSTGNLNVVVRTIDNSTVAGAVVRRYTNGWLDLDRRTTNSSGVASWTGISTGTYNLEAYYTGTFFGEEFWASDAASVFSGPTTNKTLQRNYPYASNVTIRNNATGTIISAGQSIPAGTVVRAEVTVRNNVPSTTLNVRVGFLFDISRSSPYDYDSGFSSSQSVPGSGGTRTYTFTFTLSTAGQFYYALDVQSTLANGKPVRTDSWTWKQTFNVFTPTVTVTSPNGGENWLVGSSHNITATSSGSITGVTIDYSTNGGSSWNNITGYSTTNNSVNLPWTIPNTASTTCKVRVAVTYSGGSVSDVSNSNFTIYQSVPTVTVTTPNGGENWLVGSSHNITATSSGSITGVTIDYSTNGGSSWNNITGYSTTNNSVNLPWTIPNTPSTTCRVKVTVTYSGGSVPDISNSNFTISHLEDATILAFNPPTGTALVGQQLQASVTVKNTGTTARSFWIGLSFYGDISRLWPDGWIDAKPTQTPVLQVGQSYIAVLSFTLPSWVPTGSYGGYAVIWNGYDSTLDPKFGQMIEPRYSHKDTPAFTVIDSGMEDPYAIAEYDKLNRFDFIPRAQRNNLTDLARMSQGLLKSESETALDSSNKKLIFLMHGWNRKVKQQDLYSDPNEEWYGLRKNITPPNGWVIIPYSWLEDAAPIYSIGSIQIHQSIATDAVWGTYAATLAAFRGYQHGLMMVKKLDEQGVLPSLEKVVIIAHSAGSWMALGLAQGLYYRGQANLEIQVVYLDPFIPAQSSPTLFTDRVQQKEYFNGTLLKSTPNYTRATTSGVVKTQLFYTVDPGTDYLFGEDPFWWMKGEGSATSVAWNWTYPTQGLVKRTDRDFTHEKWTGHSGPLKFYGESVNSPLAEKFQGYGWKESSVYNDKGTTNAAPTLTGISPKEGDRGSNISATLTGSNFGANTTVSANGGITVGNVVISSPTTLTASFAVPTSTVAGVYNVTVSNGTGFSSTLTGGFTAKNLAPTVASVSPVKADRGRSTTVAITGTNFETGVTTGVSFGEGITVTSFSVTNGTTISAVLDIPTSAAGGVRDVTVTSASPGGGTATKTGGFEVTIPVSVEADPTIIPKSFVLEDAYPNPFNPVMTIGFGLPERSRVTIQVYDVSGRMVAHLVNDELQAGMFQVQWNAAALSSGTYLVRMSAESAESGNPFSTAKKVSLVK